MKLIVLLIATSCLSHMNVERFFGSDYNNAILQINKCSNEINGISLEYGIDKDLVKCIVFPEFIRNSVFSGIAEEKVLELSYVELGSTVIDFSIGKFQIKPSFASKMEETISCSPNLKARFSSLLISNKDKKTERIIRLNRLKNLGWQTRYVCAFIDYCVVKYKLQNLPKTEKIKFLATAYNVGIKDLKTQIEENYEVKAFPYGQKFKIQQLSYWEVSLDYYIKYCNSPKIAK